CHPRARTRDLESAQEAALDSPFLGCSDSFSTLLPACPFQQRKQHCPLDRCDFRRATSASNSSDGTPRSIRVLAAEPDRVGTNPHRDEKAAGLFERLWRRIRRKAVSLPRSTLD